MKTINLDVLKKLQMLERGSEGGFVGELIEVFIETTSARLEALETAVRFDDFQEAVKIAHGIKSGANTLGAERIGEICQAIEEDFDCEHPNVKAKLLVEGLHREFVIFRNVLTHVEGQRWSRQ